MGNFNFFNFNLYGYLYVWNPKNNVFMHLMCTYTWVVDKTSSPVAKLD